MSVRRREKASRGGRRPVTRAARQQRRFGPHWAPAGRECLGSGGRPAGGSVWGEQRPGRWAGAGMEAEGQPAGYGEVC